MTYKTYGFVNKKIMTNSDLPEKISRHEILLKKYFAGEIDTKEFEKGRLTIDSPIDNIEITERNLTSSVIVRTDLKEVKFLKSEICDIIMFENNLESVIFKDNDLSSSDFRDCILTKSSFLNCNLEKSEFHNCKFVDCIFKSVNLSHCFLSNCSFENSKLERIDIEGSHFSKTSLNIKMCKHVNIGEHHKPRFSEFDISEKGDKSIIINSLDELDKYLS